MKKSATPRNPAAWGDTGRITVDFQVKADTVSTSDRTFQGLASTWEQDLGDDIVHPGAFTRTLDHWRASQSAPRGGKAIPLVDSHDYWSVLNAVGKLEDGTETAEGLDCTFSVVKGDDGDRYLERLRAGIVRTLSIGYKAIRYDFVESATARWGEVRNIYELSLREVSLVLFPMNEGAEIDLGSVKSVLAAARRAGRPLNDAERSALKAFRAELDALLTGETPNPDPSPAPADTGEKGDTTPAGLAPDDPRRLAMEETLRGIVIRGLAAA